MVKKFISGILGRKEEDAKAPESEEDVPDELPPLAEDAVGKISAEPKKEANSGDAAPKPDKEVPEELPPLEEAHEHSTSEETASGTLDDLDKESIPEAIKKAKLAKINAPEPPASMPNAKDDIPKPKDAYAVRERIKAGAEIGFFSNIIEHIKRHGGAKERILAGDLFSRMDNYWELRKHEIKTGAQLPAENKIEDDLMKKLDELKELEQKWQVQKLALEEDVKYIHEREREIQAKIEELNLISNELSLFRNVKPEEYFHMHNGIVLKSLHDIIDILEVIDEDTFNFHVKNNKNDFSDWIRHVFRDNRLADQIKDAKTKMEMIEALEKARIIDEVGDKESYSSVANPKKYFWLENGSVIRNLYELSDALKVMGDDLFNKHVSGSKNDFAKWVNDVFKNKQLAEKLSKAKSKREMIEILEVSF